MRTTATSALLAALLAGALAPAAASAGAAPTPAGGAAAGHAAPTARAAAAACPANTVSLGTWCLDAAPAPAPKRFVAAAADCAARGGFLPSAAQLVGAAGRVSLASRLDDDPASALIDRDPSDGLQDLREMSATLTTTRAGAGAAGSIGTSDQASGDPRIGEPSPPTAPADPEPDSLAYVTVFDNHDEGGFGGALAVGTALRYRCAYAAGGADASPVPRQAHPAPRLAQLTVTHARLSLDELVRSGVLAHLRCASTCHWRAQLRLDPAVARRLGIRVRDAHATLAATRADALLDGGGRVDVRLRPSRTAASRIRFWTTRLDISHMTLVARVTVRPAGRGQHVLERAVQVATR
jgi:hypothetical protein